MKKQAQWICHIFEFKFGVFPSTKLSCYSFLWVASLPICSYSWKSKNWKTSRALPTYFFNARLYDQNQAGNLGLTWFLVEVGKTGSWAVMPGERRLDSGPNCRTSSYQARALRSLAPGPLWCQVIAGGRWKGIFIFILAFFILMLMCMSSVFY